MTNTERIQANNAELREAIQMAENLPDAGGSGTTVVGAKSLIRKGSGYIDTGIDGANSNLTIEMRYEFVTLPTGYWNVVYAYKNETTNSTRICYNKSTYVYCCLNSVPSQSLAQTGTRYAGVVYTDVLKPESGTTFSYTSNGIKTTKSRTSGTALTETNIALLGKGTDDGVSIKVYYLKIYDDGTLVRDYVPYITQGGECGMYDKVTKQFYGNAGSGTFEVDTEATEADYQAALREMGVEV